MPGAVSPHRLSQILRARGASLMWSIPRAFRPSPCTLVTDLLEPAAAVGGVATGFDRLFAEEYARVAAIARRVRRRSRWRQRTSPRRSSSISTGGSATTPARRARPGCTTAAAHTALNISRGRPSPRGREEQLRFAETGESRRSAIRPRGGGDAPRGPRIARPHPAGARRRCSCSATAGSATPRSRRRWVIGVNGVGTRLRRAEARLRKEIGDASI